jgi:hypothetical protein
VAAELAQFGRVIASELLLDDLDAREAKAARGLDNAFNGDLFGGEVPVGLALDAYAGV